MTRPPPRSNPTATLFPHTPLFRSFRGPYLDSATPAELVAVTARLNNALRRLGSGWAVFVEAQRVPAVSYPVSEFPDVVSELVDVERDRKSTRLNSSH